MSEDEKIFGRIGWMWCACGCETFTPINAEDVQLWHQYLAYCEVNGLKPLRPSLPVNHRYHLE